MANANLARPPRAIKMAFWNANGLRESKIELEEFIDRYELDIMLVNETKLNAADLPKIPNFKFYKKDRDGRGGGTAIYIRSYIDHCELASPQLNTMEANSITVSLQNNKQVRITSVYKKPSSNFDINELKELIKDPGPFIIGGDLNAKHPLWNSRLTNRRGRELLKFAQTNNLQVVGPTSPTFFHVLGHPPDVLDIAVVRAVNVLSIDSINDLTSDHNPVVIELDMEPASCAPPASTHIDWESFAENLDQTVTIPVNIKDAATLNIAADTFADQIKSAVESSTVKKTPHPANRLALPRWLKDLIKARNKARKNWQISRSQADLREFHRIKNEVRKEICSIKQQRWRDTLENLDPQQNTMWKISKVLRSNPSSNSPLHGERGLAYSREEKAEALADSLEKQCTNVYENVDLDHVTQVHRTVRRHLRKDTDLAEIEFASPEEVLNITSRVNVRKASGPDNISNSAIRHLPKRAIVALTNIINGSLTTGQFPTSWKQAHVISIPKPGKDTKFPQNFRPISLISSVAKVAETIILKRLQAHVEANNILPNSQHAYRKNYSTQHQLLRVVEFITEGFNTKRSTGAVLLDVAKAFDQVWHKGLLYKLIKCRFPLYLIKLIASYLRGRSFRIRYKDHLSTTRQIEAGVPQGSVLSPLLYNIYVSDMPTAEGTLLAQYADDTAILYRSTSPRVISCRLQDHMDKLEEWFALWRIAINATKSTAIFMTRRHKVPDQPVTLQNTNIEWANTAKYLGVTFDRALRWQPHIEQKRKAGRTTYARLWPLLNGKSAMNTKNKLRLYRSIMVPQILYACPIWGNASPYLIKKIQSFQNRVLRNIVDAPWYVSSRQIHRDLNIPTVAEEIHKQAETFYTALDAHPSSEMTSTLRAYDATTPLRHRRPRTLLF